jgi:hypothetical protein
MPDLVLSEVHVDVMPDLVLFQVNVDVMPDLVTLQLLACSYGGFGLAALSCSFEMHYFAAANDTIDALGSWGDVSRVFACLQHGAYAGALCDRQ